MQTCILTLGILLAGQMSDSGGPRYSSLPAGEAARGGEASTSPPLVGQPAQQVPATQVPATGDPATGDPATGPTRLAKVIKPLELLRSLANAGGAEKLTGVPLSLAEAVENADSRTEQTGRVKLYWELSQTVAEHQLVSLEAVQLQSIYSGLGLAKSSQVWQQAQQTIAARSQVARSAVGVAQLRLQKELGRSGENNLPLPSDLPHCGAYQTRFDEIFQGRTSGEARQLSELIPLLHQELGQRAADTMAAHQWVNLISQQRSPQSDGAELLKAYEYLALQRRAFVSTAYQYNANIARYTELAVPQDVGADRLVGMLIESKGRAAANSQRGGIRQATAEQDLPDNSSQRDTRRTYAEEDYGEGARSRALRVPNDKDGVERSILVSPQAPERSTQRGAAAG